MVLRMHKFFSFPWYIVRVELSLCITLVSCIYLVSRSRSEYVWFIW